MSFDQLYIDVDDWIWYGEFRLPIRFTPKGMLQFKDKDQRRSAERGSPYVEVEPRKFADLEEKRKRSE